MEWISFKDKHEATCFLTFLLVCIVNPLHNEILEVGDMLSIWGTCFVRDVWEESSVWCADNSICWFPLQALNDSVLYVLHVFDVFAHWQYWWMLIQKHIVNLWCKYSVGFDIIHTRRFEVSKRNVEKNAEISSCSQGIKIRFFKTLRVNHLAWEICLFHSLVVRVDAHRVD